MNISATRKIPATELETLKATADQLPPPAKLSVFQMLNVEVIIEAKDSKGDVIDSTKTFVPRRFDEVSVVQLEGTKLEIKTEDKIHKGITKVVEVDSAKYVLFVACDPALTVSVRVLS